MFKVINTRTNRTVKDAITRKPLTFETKEAAVKLQESQNWYFNIRPENRGRKASPYEIAAV